MGAFQPTANGTPSNGVVLPAPNGAPAPKGRKATPANLPSLNPEDALVAALTKRGAKWSPNDIKLSEADETALSQRILRDFEDTRAENSQWYLNQVEMTKNWRGTPDSKPEPFEGAANLRMPVTSSFVETMKARLLKAIFGGGDIAKMASVDGSIDKTITDEGSLWFGWELKNVVKFRNLIKGVIHNALVHGLGIVIPNFEHQERMLRQVREFKLDPASPLSAQLMQAISQIMNEKGSWGADTKEKVEVAEQSEFGIFKLSDGGQIKFCIRESNGIQVLGCEVWRTNVVFDGVRGWNVDLDDLVFPNTAEELEDLPFFGVRYFEQFEDFMQGIRDGYYRQFDKDELEHIMAGGDIKSGQEINREEAHLADSEEGTDSEDVAATKPNRTFNEFYRWEGWWHWTENENPYDIDTLIEPATQIVGVIEVHSRRVVKVARLEDINKDAKRSAVKFGFIREPGRFITLGLASWLRHIQSEIDANHNTRQDAGLLTVAPFGFYEPLSGAKKDNLKIIPGVLQPVKNPEKIVFPRLNSLPTASMQDEMMSMGYASEQAGLSQQARGVPTSKRQSASEYVGVSAALDVRTEDILEDLIESVSDLLYKILGLYQQFGPRQRIFLVSGADGEALVKRFELDRLQGRIQLTVLGNLAQSNDQLQRQIAIDMFQMLLNELLIGLGIVKPDTIYGAIKLVAKSMHYDGVPLHRPDVPEDSDSPSIEHKQLARGEKPKGPTMNENFNEHLQAHLKFSSDPHFEEIMPPEGKVALAAHIKQTAEMQQQVQLLRTMMAAQAATAAANQQSQGIQPGKDGDQRPGTAKNRGPASSAERAGGAEGGGAGGKPAGAPSPGAV